MKLFGYALVTIGFLGAAFETVRQVDGVNTVAFLMWLAVGVIGVMTLRLAARREATDEVRQTANIETLEASLKRIVEASEWLEAEKANINVYDLRRRIDERFPEQLTVFVDARESIAHTYGLQAYSEVMNPFAAGERYLNRVWSASTDGYVDEAHTYVAKATEQFRDALGAFEGIRAAAPRTGRGI